MISACVDALLAAIGTSGFAPKLRGKFLSFLTSALNSDAPFEIGCPHLRAEEYHQHHWERPVNEDVRLSIAGPLRSATELVRFVLIKNARRTEQHIRINSQHQQRSDWRSGKRSGRGGRWREGSWRARRAITQTSSSRDCIGTGLQRMQASKTEGEPSLAALFPFAFVLGCSVLVC